MSEAIKIVAQNRKAYHDYYIHEKLEAGIILKGTEIKSIRAGKANLRESYAQVVDNEVYLVNCRVSPYDPASQFNHDPLRRRKLLLHKREIKKLFGKTRIQGASLVPLKIYLKRGMAKLELGLGTGKKEYDKRQTIKKREADIAISQAMRKKRYTHYD